MASHKRTVLAATAVLAAFLIGGSWILGSCSSSSNGSDADTDVDTDTDTDTDTGTDTGTDKDRKLVWSERQEVDLNNAGITLDMAVSPNDVFGIAYYKRGDDTGLCETPILGGPPTPVHQDSIRYAWLQDGTWQLEDVKTDLENEYIAGISIVFTGDGTPLVAYQGGEESSQCCGGSDLIVAARTGPGAWTETAVVTDSNQAAAGGDCPKMQSICDTGDTVGLWPSLAVSPDGTVGVTYRDIHLCYAKEDQDSSDLEFASMGPGSGWGTHQWIDIARGAGNFSRLAFGPDGSPAVVHYNGKFQMLMFAKRTDQGWSNQPCPGGTDAECPQGQKCIHFYCAQLVHTKAFDHPAPEGSIDMAVDPNGGYLVAYFDPDKKSLRVAYSGDGRDWKVGLIDSNGSVGLSPSIVFDPVTGMPGVAYYRCSDYDPNELECNRNQDGVYFSYFEGDYPAQVTDQKKWKRTVVSQDSVASDGLHISAAVLSDGTVGVAYSYSWWDASAGGEGKLHLMFNKGTWE